MKPMVIKVPPTLQTNLNGCRNLYDKFQTIFGCGSTLKFLYSCNFDFFMNKITPCMYLPPTKQMVEEVPAQLETSLDGYRHVCKTLENRNQSISFLVVCQLQNVL